MMGTNYYCAGGRCRKTTRHVCVRMDQQVYYYCVECGRRLEVRVTATSAPAVSAESDRIAG